MGELKIHASLGKQSLSDSKKGMHYKSVRMFEWDMMIGRIWIPEDYTFKVENTVGD